MREPREFDLFGFIAFAVSVPIALLIPLAQLAVLVLGVYSFVHHVYAPQQEKPKTVYEENMRNYQEFLEKQNDFLRGW